MIRFKCFPIAIILGCFTPSLVNANEEEATYFDRWENLKDELQAQGVNRTMFLVSAILMEGNSLAGFCSEHLTDHEVAYWTEFDLGTEPAALQLKARASTMFRDGLRKGLHDEPSAELCAASMQSLHREWRVIQLDLQAEKSNEPTG